MSDDCVKSCPKLESGLRLGQEGIHACQAGPFSSPVFWTAEEASLLSVTRHMIAEKRQWIFDLLNDEHANTPCKHCHRVVLKPRTDVRFDKLGHIDLAATTTCNLRCNFCGYTQTDSFSESSYDALAILREYSPAEVLWDAAVDFNGGEPTLLPNFDAYLEYFRSRCIRVFLYSNALVFKRTVVDGLRSGVIRWLCTSLDAGTAGTFEKTKRSTRFNDVLENLERYARAGETGTGQLAVKYIFTQDNCNDANVDGFCNVMAKIRPQEVWLTFDFMPLANLPGNSEDFGGFDYAPLIAAYARMWVILNQTGLTTVHFYEKHLANDSLQGKRLLASAKAAIQHLGWTPSHVSVQRIPLQDISFAKKRIVLAPASLASRQLLDLLTKAQIIAFCDRDTTLHEKQISGIPILSYAKLQELAPDIVLICAPDQHARAILEAVSFHADQTTRIYLLP